MQGLAWFGKGDGRATVVWSGVGRSSTESSKVRQGDNALQGLLL